MPLIVDVYNLLHAALGPSGGGRDLGVLGLARLIGQSRYSADPSTLVCDGTRPANAEGWAGGRPEPVRIELVRPELVRIVYAGKGQDADSLIEGLIERDTAPKRLVVVSSDRRVQVAARKRRAQWLTSESFLGHLLRDAAGAALGKVPAGPRDRVPLGRAEVDHWVREFGDSISWALELSPSPDALRLNTAPAKAGRPAKGQPAAEQGRKPGPAPGARPDGGAGTRATRREAPSNETKGVEGDRAASKPGSSNDPLQSDPLLIEAMRVFKGRLNWDDLDMERWLSGGSTGSS